ncbi:hypothetical protein [Neopusillimonas aromaticivorans]|uniref:hypothetical protein n=1 Tax=Neopusillimonas aromaticivorans TaxID=2979868 RepID=UPI002591424B|nr:hypothetical protein [Neopusillimonas aromaticivorans]WJJ94297.1 hypothetical protein N7E01_04435 [Neopusillimonas aromaticivorans]
MQVSTRIETGNTVLRLSAPAVHTRTQGYASRMRAGNSQLRLATEGNHAMQLHPLPRPFIQNVDNREPTLAAKPDLLSIKGSQTLNTSTGVCHG